MFQDPNLALAAAAVLLDTPAVEQVEQAPDAKVGIVHGVVQGEKTYPTRVSDSN